VLATHPAPPQSDQSLLSVQLAGHLVPHGVPPQYGVNFEGTAAGTEGLVAAFQYVRRRRRVKKEGFYFVPVHHFSWEHGAVPVEACP